MFGIIYSLNIINHEINLWWKICFLSQLSHFQWLPARKILNQLSEKKSTADSQQLENSKTCYRSVIGQDTVKLAINDSKRNITGDLDFRSAVTDGSAGKFSGTNLAKP